MKMYTIVKPYQNEYGKTRYMVWGDNGTGEYKLIKLDKKNKVWINIHTSPHIDYIDEKVDELGGFKVDLSNLNLYLDIQTTVSIHYKNGEYDYWFSEGVVNIISGLSGYYTMMYFPERTDKFHNSGISLLKEFNDESCDEISKLKNGDIIHYLLPENVSIKLVDNVIAGISIKKERVVQ